MNRPPSPVPQPTRIVRVLVVDDHPLIRQGLRSCLAAEPEIKVVGEAADGHAALEAVSRHLPDVVLMDLNLPRLSGVQAAAAIRRQWPQVRIIILSVHNQREYVVESIAVGAHGFLSKDAAPEELVRVIAKVAGGEAHFDLADTVKYLQRHAPAAPCGSMARGKMLSAREEQVLARVADGESNHVIAARLGISVRTVETSGHPLCAHRKNIAGYAHGSPRK